MSRRYLAFDIETAKDVPGDDFDWKPHRPLGISCIASIATGDAEPRLWCSRDNAGRPAEQMTVEDLSRFLDFLGQSQQAGVVPLTWNGLGFDFDVLAEESQQAAECCRLAQSHVDMMFHVVCEKGFPVALQNAALGLGLPGKLAGVEGFQAPVLWAQGAFDRVFEYVGQDVRTTLAVAAAAEQQREFRWKTRKGTISGFRLTGGWLNVEQALQLPLPDTSWMSSPPVRSDFMGWMH